MLTAFPALAGQTPPEQEAVSEAVTTTELGGGAMFGADSFLSLIIEAGPVSWIVLFTLLVFSLVSWAIILTKSRRLRRPNGTRRPSCNRFPVGEAVFDVVGSAAK